MDRAQPHTVWMPQAEQGTGNRVLRRSQARQAMSQAQGPSRESNQEQKERGSEAGQETSYDVCLRGPSWRRATYNKFLRVIQEAGPETGLETGTPTTSEGPGLSRNGAPGPMGRGSGWKPQVRLAIKAFWCTQDTDIQLKLPAENHTWWLFWQHVLGSQGNGFRSASHFTEVIGSKH